MPRPNIGKRAANLTKEKRAEVARLVADWAEVARVHSVLVDRAALEEQRLRATPRAAPEYEALSFLAEDLAGMRDVLVAVVDASRAAEVARRIRDEWTRMWLGRRRALLTGWLKDHKQRGAQPTPSDEQMRTLAAIFRTESIGLGWTPPSVDHEKLVRDLNEYEYSTVLSEEGPAKAADALLADHLDVSDQKLRRAKRSFGHGRIRRPRGLPET